MKLAVHVQIWGHISCLHKFVQQKKIDILLINETHLTCNERTLKIPNYFSYSTNHPQAPGHSAGSGTATFVHKMHIHTPVAIQTVSVENTTAQFIILINIYILYVWKNSHKVVSCKRIEAPKYLSRRGPKILVAALHIAPDFDTCSVQMVSNMYCLRSKLQMKKCI